MPALRAFDAAGAAQIIQTPAAEEADDRVSPPLAPVSHGDPFSIGCLRKPDAMERHLRPCPPQSRKRQRVELRTDGHRSVAKVEQDTAMEPPAGGGGHRAQAAEVIR